MQATISVEDLELPQLEILKLKMASSSSKTIPRRSRSRRSLQRKNPLFRVRRVKRVLAWPKKDSQKSQALQ